MFKKLKTFQAFLVWLSNANTWIFNSLLNKAFLKGRLYLLFKGQIGLTVLWSATLPIWEASAALTQHLVTVLWQVLHSLRSPIGLVGPLIGHPWVVISVSNSSPRSRALLFLPFPNDILSVTYGDSLTHGRTYSIYVYIYTYMHVNEYVDQYWINRGTNSDAVKPLALTLLVNAWKDL